ncbi:MAG: hypothetical protein V9H26_02255 [Verrucomicrobiota bacterium]
MSHIHPNLPRRRSMACLIRLLLAGGVIGGWQSVAAHDLFTNYVQHCVQLTVGARHLDLTVDLTFFEEWSARERQTMDANPNGRITRSELEAYLKPLAARLSGQVKLRVAGHELPLALLYDPEVDLMTNDQTGPGHHRLRLFYFAPTPTTLRAEDEIVVEDRLWPEAKLLGTLQSEGHDGCKLTTEISIKAGRVPPPPDAARWFKFRCVKPPVANPATLEAASARPPIPSPPPPAHPSMPASPTQPVP